MEQPRERPRKLREALKKLREAQALSQRDLSELSGVAQSTISLIEQGERKAQPSTLRKLFEALGVEPAARAHWNNWEVRIPPDEEAELPPDKEGARPPHSQLVYSVDPLPDYLNAMNRLEVYRAECDEVSRSLKTGLDSDSYTLVASAAEMAVLKARDIVANEADKVSEYSPTTWREVLSVLQKLLDIQLVAAKKLPTLTKSSREAAEGDQMAAVLSAFRISSEGR